MDKKIKFKDIIGHYFDEGKGRPLILIHGFCEDGSIFNGLIKELTAKFRIIVPDLPGYRNSTMPKEELTIDWMADFIKSILDREKISKPIIIGHSMGGYITLALAEKYPALPDLIGLFHSHCFADDDEKKKSRQKAIDFINKNGTESFVNELYNNLFDEKFQSENKEIIENLKMQARGYQAETVVSGLRAMIMRPDRAHVLKPFSRPVLFIFGKSDKAIPYQKSLEQCSFPEITDVHILENVGHMGMIEESKKTLNMIEEFANLKVTQSN